MKATIITALFALTSALAQQKTITTGSYDKITVSGPYAVRLISGHEGNIELSGDEKALSGISVQLEGTTLRIKPVKKFSNNNSKVMLTVPVEAIDEIVASGSGNVTSDITLKSENLKFGCSGSGHIFLSVEAQNLEASLTGSGEMKLSGNATNFVARLSGSGNLHAFDLKTANTDVSVSGSGNSKVFSQENLMARVSGSGQIDYKGNPKKEDIKVSGSGRISKS